MKKVPVDQAVGMVLGHDMTQIIPGQFKGPRFKKGHVVREEDIEVLKSMGKEHIYILELKAGMIHENEAAIRMAKATAGKGLKLTDPAEGKVSFQAEYAGMLKIDVDRLFQINSIDNVVLATLHTNQMVQEGQNVAGTRINPLVIEEEPVLKVEKIAAQGEPLLQILPVKVKKVGIVVTGNEVYYGRIQDEFAPVFQRKVREYGVQIEGLVYAPDDPEVIKAEILKLRDAGAEVIITAGGMSVDPDDVTPEGIRRTEAKIVRFGAPVLPGAMFMMAYLDEIPILGVPACAMFHQITVFDLIFPRALVGSPVHKEDIARLGHGGLCMNCDVCHYPTCPFGKA